MGDTERADTGPERQQVRGNVCLQRLHHVHPGRCNQVGSCSLYTLFIRHFFFFFLFKLSSTPFLSAFLHLGFLFSLNFGFPFCPQPKVLLCSSTYSLGFPVCIFVLPPTSCMLFPYLGFHFSLNLGFRFFPKPEDPLRFSS